MGSKFGAKGTLKGRKSPGAKRVVHSGSEEEAVFSI